MIRKITLKKFGKFEGESFNLSQVNVFMGPNEAGKTTLQDAFFYALCRPSGTKASGKELNKRYQKMDVLLEPEQHFSFDEEEYRQLLSIKADNISFDISDNSKWLDKVKSQLFSGGINLDIIAGSLSKKSSVTKTTQHMKKLGELETLGKKHESRLEFLSQEKIKIHRRGEDINRMAADLAEVKTAVTETNRTLSNLGEKLIFFEKIREKIRMKAILKAFDDHNEKKEKLKSLSLYSEKNFQEMESYGGRIKKLEMDRIALESKINEISESCRNQKETLQKSSLELKELKNKSERSSFYLDRISIFRREIMKKPQGFDFYRIAAAGIFLLCMPAGWVFSLEPEYFRFIIASVSLLLSLYFLFSVFYKRSGQGSKDRDFLSGLLEEWRSEFDENLLFERLESFESHLHKNAAEYSGRKKIHEEAEKLLISAEGQLEEQKRLLEELGKNIRDSEQKRDAFFQKYSVFSRDDFLLKMNEAKNLGEEIKKIEGLEEFQEDPRKTAEETQFRLKILEEEGIPSEGFDEMAFRRMKAEKLSLEKQLKEFSEKEKNLSVQKEGISGEIKGGLKGILDEMFSEELILDKIKKDKREIEYDRRGAELALEIFGDIKNKTENSFSALEDELKKYASGIFQNERSVSILKMKENQIQIEDKGGSLRSVDLLSTGTKDSFVFASKLALASKTFENDGILVLDDPFLHLDDARQKKAVQMLFQFQKDKNWQILLFTKEKKLCDLMDEIFNDCAVHVLN